MDLQGVRRLICKIDKETLPKLVENHDPTGPSQIYRVLQCSPSASLPYPELPDKKDAEEGTEHHEDISRYLTEGILPEAEEAQRIVEHAEEFLLRVINEEFGGAELIEVYVEQTVAAFIMGDLHWGTPDVILVFQAPSGDISVVIIDWKTGWVGPLDDAVTCQLGCYAALFCAYFALTDYGLATFHGYCCNPRIGWSKFCEDIDVDMASAFWADVTRTVDEDFNPGGWCKYCPGLGVCEGTQELSRDVVRDVTAFTDTDLAELPKKTREAILAERLSVIPAEVLQPIADKYELLRSIMAALKARFEELLTEDPDSLDGYSYKEQKQKRRATSASGIRTRLEEDGVPPEKIEKAMSISVPAAETLWKEQTGLGREDFEARFFGLIEQPVGRVFRPCKRKRR